MKQNHLIFFTQAIGEEEVLMAHAVDWVRNLSDHFDKVSVFCIRSGVFKLPANVSVRTLGGGSFPKRIRASVRLLKSIRAATDSSHQNVVLYHMSATYPALLGPFFRILGVPQALWYSHKTVTLRLLLATVIVDKILSPTDQTFPINTRKGAWVGQAINIPAKIMPPNPSAKGAVVLGRVARVKRLEQGLRAIGKLPLHSRPSLTLIGPIADLGYEEELKQLAHQIEVQVIFREAVPHSEVLRVLREYLICLNTTDGGLDKSALEAGVAGCLVLSSNSDVLSHTGMDQVLAPTNQSSIEVQLANVMLMTTQQLDKARDFVQRTTIAKSDLAHLCAEIANKLSYQ